MPGGDPGASDRDIAFGAGALVGELAFSIALLSLVKLVNPEIPVFAAMLCRYLFCLPLLVA